VEGGDSTASQTPPEGESEEMKVVEGKFGQDVDPTEPLLESLGGALKEYKLDTATDADFVLTIIHNEDLILFTNVGSPADIIYALEVSKARCLGL
jgi:hypothetical protein